MIPEVRNIGRLFNLFVLHFKYFELAFEDRTHHYILSEAHNNEKLIFSVSERTSILRQNLSQKVEL